MASPHYAAHITRLLWPGTTTFFEVELVPLDRRPGRVPTRRVRVVIQADPDAPAKHIAAKARELLVSLGAAEWSGIV